ncbi:pirin family protein [Novosphingobium sp.]|uniref:pirin family protein n=1 Tax=Novosphingobium sp. TaxID=1874826 RepID=UPI003B51FF9C
MQQQEQRAPAVSALRAIEARVAGRQHGPISRLVSPDDWGERLKPFIFLDFFNAEIEPGFGFGMHPHSGIATLTWQPGSDVRYQDTTGKNGILQAGGLEWMNAGGGAWHQGSLLGQGRVTGFQLWVPMPPGIEDGPSFGQYVAPDEVPDVQIPGGSVKVLLGSMEDGAAVHSSPITSHHDMNYFVVGLEAGAVWRYSPPQAHDVAWIFAFEGAAILQGENARGELLVLGNSGDIEIAATGEPTRVLLGTAKHYTHPLVMGPSSVHSNANSLARGAEQIQALRVNLVAQGLL